MTYTEAIAAVKQIHTEYCYYKTIASLFEMDLWTGLPEKGGPYRQQVVAFIGSKKDALFRTDAARSAARYFAAVPLDDIEDRYERGLVRTYLRNYRNATAVPEELTRRFNLIKSDVLNAWTRARAAGDYRIFQPWLEQVFTLKKQIALALDPDAPAFDTLIGLTDEGLDAATVSRAFDTLRDGITALLAKIAASHDAPDASVLAHREDPARVAAFARRLAVGLGYDLKQGAISHNVVHGFSMSFGPHDSRYYTQFEGTMHMIFTCLHETGHAMYSGNGNERVNALGLWGGIHGGFHEANSRFYENIIGKSRAFWHCHYPQLASEFPWYADLGEDGFYRAINAVHPSLRRIEADEVTYSLHVILRFEIERDYFGGALAIGDIAEAWNEKCERLFGMRPSNDTEGALQDMHWAGDFIGYFQSYALGNIYGGQFREALLRDMPDAFDSIAAGDFARLKAWMAEHIWQYGSSLTAAEVLKNLTGGGLDAKPFLRYLDEKYSAIYKV